MTLTAYDIIVTINKHVIGQLIFSFTKVNEMTASCIMYHCHVHCNNSIEH